MLMRLVCLQKPLTMYFLRKAHGLYISKPERTLSPSFWDSEGKNADDRSGFDAIMPGIEHPLGLYWIFFSGFMLQGSFRLMHRSVTVYNWRRVRCCAVFPWFASRVGRSTCFSNIPQNEWNREWRPQIFGYRQSVLGRFSRRV